MNDNNDNMTEFLYFSVFGCTRSFMEEHKDEAAIKCVQRAYRDFCRTLSFKENVSDEKKNDEKKDWEDQVKTSCLRLLKSEKREVFDHDHKKICEDLSNKCNESNILKKSFTYGQAQKWINMTLKYMRLTGIWDDESNPNIEAYLHVPVDSYILEAVSDPEKSKLKETIAVRNKKGDLEPYNKNSSLSLPWSKWDYEKDYYPFIKELRGQVDGSTFDSLFQWESIIWPKIAMEENPKN